MAINWAVNAVLPKWGISIKVYDFYRDICGLKDEGLIQRISSVTEHRYLKKGEFVVRIGEVLSDVYFLETGISRGYLLDAGGKDVTDCFSFRCGSAVMPFCQMEQDLPSPMAIEMLEDGSFFCVPISEVIELQKIYKELIVLYNQLLIKALNEHWKLKQILNQYTALQRYQWFLQEYPDLINRVSNKHIASFIGMTPVTLSRLRRALREERRLK